MTSQRDRELAQRAKKHGANYADLIVEKARLAEIPISLGFALIEQESNFRNVFGHDNGKPFEGAGQVTEAKYKAYKKQRGSTGKGGQQGVGLGQLTHYTFQDRADALGGCWIPEHNIHVAFTDLAKMIDKHGKRKGIGVYNAGEGGWAQGKGHDYADEVLKKERRWHDRLTA